MGGITNVRHQLELPISRLGVRDTMTVGAYLWHVGDEGPSVSAQEEAADDMRELPSESRVVVVVLIEWQLFYSAGVVCGW